MENKNQKNPTTPFEVHTLQSDNAARKSQPQQNAQASHDTPLPTPSSPKQSSEPNPFLSDTLSAETDGIGKNTFAPTSSSEQEKINYAISDISPELQDAPQSTEQKKSSWKKILLITAGILLIFFVAGGAYYYISTQKQETPSPTPDTPREPEIPTLQEDPTPEPSTYSLNMPNYFTIDLASPSVATEITTQLSTIRTQLSQQSPTDPVIFIVTDSTTTPISFHQFAIAAKLGLTEDILSVLDKNFELYAYSDPEIGIRFGLVVDIKDPLVLQSTLVTQEHLLPQTLAPFLSSEVISTHPIVFQDNTYYNKPLRYTNLNEEETYSIDYAIFNKQWLIGTSKNTLRAIFDTLHEKTSYQEPLPEFSY